jgi:hypothetical protein
MSTSPGRNVPLSLLRGLKPVDGAGFGVVMGRCNSLSGAGVPGIGEK